MTTESQSPAPTGNSPTQTQETSTTTPSQEVSGSTGAQEPQSPTDLGSEEKKNDSGKPDGPAASATDLGTDPEPEGEKKDEGTPPAWAEFHGAPEEGTDYELSAPDGYEVDDELRSAFTPVARELNLSSKGAQKLVELKAKDIQMQTERWGRHLTELRTQAQADPEIGGAKYNEAVAAGRRVISKFGTPGLRKLMNDYGVGAHPEMIRFMRKIDAAMGEPSTLPSGDGPGVVTQKPLHEILYKD